MIADHDRDEVWAVVAEVAEVADGNDHDRHYRASQVRKRSTH